MVNRDLGQHGVVLKLGRTQWGSVASDDHQLGLSVADRLEGRLVAEGVFTGLDHYQVRIHIAVEPDGSTYRGQDGS